MSQNNSNDKAAMLAKIERDHPKFCVNLLRGVE